MALPFPTPIRRRATMVVALAFLATAACDQGSSMSFVSRPHGRTYLIS